jgi:acyl dehydratase
VGKNGGMFFEDFEVGRTYRFGQRTVTQDELIAFAREFDPQPFHIDPEAAEKSHFGGLIASGWHTVSICMRHIIDDLYGQDAGSIGASGIDELRWPVAVRPGDTLSFWLEVMESKISERRPDRGRLVLKYAADNQHGDTVVSMLSTVYFLRREA